MAVREGGHNVECNDIGGALVVVFILGFCLGFVVAYMIM